MPNGTLEIIPLRPNRSPRSLDDHYHRVATGEFPPPRLDNSEALVFAEATPEKIDPLRFVMLEILVVELIARVEQLEDAAK